LKLFLHELTITIVQRKPWMAERWR